MFISPYQNDIFHSWRIDLGLAPIKMCEFSIRNSVDRWNWWLLPTALHHRSTQAGFYTFLTYVILSSYSTRILHPKTRIDLVEFMELILVITPRSGGISNFIVSFTLFLSYVLCNPLHPSPPVSYISESQNVSTKPFHLAWTHPHPLPHHHPPHRYPPPPSPRPHFIVGERMIQMRGSRLLGM